MSAGTKIEWTDTTWNPVRGCSLVSDGCRNCYAMKQAHRFSGPGKPYEGLTRLGKHGPTWTGNVRFVPEALKQPLRWRKPRRVFVNSMSDLFHEDLTNEEIAAVFGIMARCPQHTFQVLTKRPERLIEWFIYIRSPIVREEIEAVPVILNLPEFKITTWPLPNVWLGVSVEDQKTADERIPLLLQTPAAVRFVSAEPLLGPISFSAWVSDEPCPACSDELHPCGEPKIDWLIVGGESGPGARPMHPEWARSIRDQCQDAGVAFHFKQWGEWSPNYGGEPRNALHVLMGDYDNRLKMWRVGKKTAGRDLDGRTWDEFPTAGGAK